MIAPSSSFRVMAIFEVVTATQVSDSIMKRSRSDMAYATTASSPETDSILARTTAGIVAGWVV